MLADAQASYLRALFVTGLIATTSLTAASAGPASPSQKTSPAQKAQIVENYGKLPLSFEANTGQADKNVKFLSRGSGYGLHLTGKEAVLELLESGVRSQKSGASRKPRNSKLHGAISGPLIRSLERSTAGSTPLAPSPQPPAPSVLRMQLAGASGTGEPMGEEQLPGTVNYFIGNDPARWHTSVPTYAKVRYAGIYPGIDLVYYGNPSADGQLEYDFVVAPGADPSVIALDVAAGLSRHPSSKSGGVPTRSGQVPPPLQIAADGDLVIKTDGGEIRFHKPVVYQEQFTVDSSQVTVQDEKRNTTDNQKSKIQIRKFLEGHYVLTAANQIHFALGSYDHTRPLVIDPVLEYSTYLGGSGEDSATAITVDTAGNAYVTGLTTSTDFPVTPGAFQSTNKDSENNSTSTAFVTKLNPAGTALVYSTYLGGSGGGSSGDLGSAIALDTAGNVYVAGQTSSTDFPVTQGAFQTTNKAAAIKGINAFVAKLNPGGTALVYSTYLGGSGGQNQPGDSASGLAVDSSGNAYVTGTAGSTDFPVTQGAFQTTNHAAANDLNAFVTKLNATGTALVYSTYLGGSGTELGGDMGNAIAVDTGGNVYVAGQTYSTDFPVTPGAFQTTNHAAANVSTNAFVTKLNPTGTALVYSTYLGGSGVKVEYPGDVGNAIAVDTAGNVYVAGYTYSTDFPVTQGAFQTTNHTANSTSNAFVTKLNPAGTALVYSTYLGGSGGVLNIEPVASGAAGDLARGLVIDGSGNAYVIGSAGSADFPVTPGAYQTTNHDQPGCVGGCIGGYNAFITELNSTGSALVYSTYLGGDGITPRNTFSPFFGEGDQASALAADNSGNVYVTGGAQSYDFPVTAGAFQTTLTSWFVNPFVTKLNMSATSTATTPMVTVTPASSTITSAQAATVTVSVSGGSGNPTPTGMVTLLSSSYSSAATTLSAGSATIDIPVGNCRETLDEEWIINNPTAYCQDLLAATYIPDTASSSTYNFSSGLGLVNVVLPNISVTPSSSTLTWAQSQSQALPVAIAVTGGTGNPVPTGTVTLTTGSWTSAATALSGGSATISIPPGTLTKGGNSLNVSYSGDSNYAAVAIDGSAVVTVGGVTVSVVPASSTINSTQPLPVTITVSAASGSPIPTGMVTLASGSYISAATALAGGSATITIPAGTLALGGDLLEASYGGDANYGVAQGGALVTVTPGSPSFTITGTAVTVTAGATTGNTSTITVTPAGGFTGSVALTAAVTSSPAGALDPPTLSFGSTSPVSITGPSAGTATLTISTTAANTCVAASLTHRRVPWYPAGGAALACILLFGIPGRRCSWRRMHGLLTLLVALTCGVLACGGGGRNVVNCGPIIPGTTAGTYIVTVTGTSGSTTATGTVTLTVQ